MAAWNPQANDIFLKAVEISSWDERQVYLAATCGDAALRAQVDALLQASVRAGNFLDSPATGLAVTADETLSEGPGTRIGPYKLLEQIGEGGMGTVFLAEQIHPVERKVALKLIKPGLDSRQVIARFEQERQALALMDHPNIAKVLDAGTVGIEENRARSVSEGRRAPSLADAAGSDSAPGHCPVSTAGRPYFVMELVKGVPLTQYCDQRRLTPRERLELFIPVCHAVQHAHQKGIIHRDIKPSNVLVALYDGRPVSKVIDFGVAKATGPKLTERTLFTEFGALVGTLEYMSPEQAELNQLDIDTRSDIYSLGVLLYELLTGTTPLGHSRAKDAGLLEALRIIREEETPRPSARLSTIAELPVIAANRGLEPHKLSGLVKGELDWIVMKALEKERNRRYDSANALAQDIERYLRDEPVLACPPSLGYRLGKFARRHRVKLAVAASLLVAVTVTAAAIGWAVGDRAARQSRLVAELRNCLDSARTLVGSNQLTAARQTLAEARAQMGDDRPALAELAKEIDAAHDELDRLQRFRDLNERFYQADMPFPEAEAGADSSGGRAQGPTTIQMRKRRPEAQLTLLRQALQEYEVLQRDDWSSSLQGALLGPDQVQYIRRTVYEELLWLASTITSSTLREQVRSRLGLSAEAAAREALVYLGKAEAVHQRTHGFYVLRARCRQALGQEAAAQADRQLAEQTPPTLVVDYMRRGRAAYEAKRLPQAVAAYEAALRLDPANFWALMWLGMSLRDLGQGPEHFAGAAGVFSGCILKRPDFPNAYYGRALAYTQLRRCRDALRDLDTVIELAPNDAHAWNQRGVIYCDYLRQFEQAVADFSKAIELAPKYALAWGNRGWAFRKLGQWDKALADCSKAIELDPKYAKAWNGRGAIYCDLLAQYEKAVADFSKAIELDPKNASTWGNRGNAYRKLGQPESAVADWSRALELDPMYAPWWRVRGLAYAEVGQPDKGLADLSKSIDLDSKQAQTWINRGVIYFEHLAQYEKALADFSRATELDPKLADAWFNRGNAYRNLGQLHKAVADYSSAIELGSNYPGAWCNRGLAYSALGQWDKAVRDLSKCIDLAPNHRHAGIPLNELAWLLATCPAPRVQEPHRAVELASKAVKLSPKMGKYWNTLGVAHYRAGHWKAAVAALAKSVELSHGGDASDHLFLAMAHWQQCNRDLARRSYYQAFQWLEKHKATLAKNKLQAEELRRFTNEAEELLELKKK
jgi:tetratricopeptide (TPR) repeat protein/serine/threonine protein kinase